MVNSGSFDSDGQGDRNAKVGCTQPHNASDSTQSSSPVTASAAAPCKTDFSQTADSDLPSVAHAIEPTPTKTEFNCDMPVENFTNLSSVDGAVEERENPPASGSEDEKTSLCCSLPLDKVQGVLTPYHPSATKADEDGTKVKQPTRKLLCLYCDRSFASVNLRQKHVERIHSVKQNRRFSSRRQNQLTVTPCVYCDKINGTENTLKDLFQHLVNEHSSKYFGCLPCEDRFLTSSLLVDHNVSKHNYSAPQTSNKLETPGGTNKTPLKVAKPDDVKVESEEEEAEEVPVKLTRSRMRPKPEEEGGKGKKAIVSNKKKSTKLKEMRTKKLSVKSSRIALKRRESKRLQAIAKIDSQKKKQPKPGTEKKQSNISKLEQTNSTKSTEKAKLNSTCINPYPEFDHFYRVKKITDHSIDNLKISSLTFDDVFDKAFFNRIKCNIEENLLHHIDGKLFKNEESESRISNFEKVSNVPQEVQNSNSENYGCELSLNAVTPVASLSLNSQFGEDFESQIEYGSKPSKKKTQTRRDEIHYKYFTRRKYQASILEHKENRDLSKLDMWTQLVIKKRQQKMLDDKKSAKEILEYTTCDEYKNKVQREELNRILDRRGPFEDLKEEASKKAALDKLNSVSEDSISQESFTEVRQVLNEILNRVFATTEEITAEVETAKEKAANYSNKKADLREIPAYLNLRRSSSLPSDGEIDKSDKIALICSSQETENFELPTNQVRGKNELIELTGEWARCRMYICAACGAKLPNMKYLLEHKSLYHQNVWVQHYEFVGNQSELYRHLSIPALGKVGAVEESIQCKVWRRSDARVCTKCGKQCNALGELHRHILECGGDWTWMLARKKCKYRPFGAKSRRKRRGLVHRFHHKQKTEPTEKKTYKKTFDGPRQRPSDADTIQRMLANLPAKRSTRKLISLHDGIYRARKKSQINNINQNKVKCGKVIYKSSSRKETTEKTVNNSISVTGKNQKNKPSSNRRSLRSLNKVLASRILDTNTKLSVKRKIKVLNEQRRTRRSQFLVEEVKETVIEDNSATVCGSPPTAKSKTKSAKKEEKETPEAEVATKRSSPRSSPKNVTKKMTVKKLLTGKINIKSFFPVKKRKNRKTLTENQKPEATKSEVENIDVKTRSKRKSKEIPDTEEKKKEEIVITEVVSKKSKSETFSNLIKSLNIHKKKSTKAAVQNKTADPTLSVGKNKKQIETKKSSDKDEKTPAEDDKKSQPNETNKKRKLKRSFRNVINRVKKLKIENTSDSTLQVEELPQNQKNNASTFLEESQPEESVPPAQPEKIVIPSTLEAKENTADISTPAPIVMDFREANENSPIPETIFKLESNNEKSLQAKGALDFDTQKIEPAVKDTSSAGSETALEYNEKTGPISIETSVKPKMVPLVSPNMKGKIRKPARGLNDCIAMLTSKLQQKIEDKPGDSMFSLSTPNIVKESCPAKAECILRIPTFKSQKLYPEVEETALDLSTKSISNTDLSEKQTEVVLDITAKDNSKIGEINKIERSLAVTKTVPADDKTSTEILHDSVDRIIEEVVENKIQPALHKWNSVDETIQEVVDNHHQIELILPSRNTIDDIIDFVVEYGKDKDIVIDNKTVLKSKEIMEKPVRKIGSVRKPKNKKFVEATNNKNIADLTPNVVFSISKEQLENNVATMVAVEETVEETVGNTRSSIENSSEALLKRTGSMKKKNSKVDNIAEIRPQNIGEKMKFNVETLDDDIENKNLLDRIDTYLNEASIDTPDTAVGKIGKKNSKVDNIAEIKPRNIGEKMKFNVETMDDDIENKNLLDKIDTYLNEAFIDTRDTSVGKIGKNNSKVDNIAEVKPRNIGEKMKSNVETLDDDIENKNLLDRIDTYLNEASIDTPDTSVGKIGKKNSKVDNIIEIKPRNICEKKKFIVETLDDDIENKNLLDRIDTYLNEAFIDTPDTAVGKIGKTGSTKNKKASRKIGQARNRSQSKIKSPTELKLTNKKLLETNVNTLLDVKEIDANPDVFASSLAPQNLSVGNETTMTKAKEIKQLSNEDEPHLLENKVMTSQLKTSLLQSDSEDDIPLAALVKPDELAIDKCEDKSEDHMEDSVPFSKITAVSPNLLLEKKSGTNTQIYRSLNSTEAESASKELTKRRSKSIIEENENPNDKLPIIETVSSYDDNTKIAPFSILKTEENLEGNDFKDIAEYVDKSDATKKRSLKNTSKLDSNTADISLVGINPEERTIEDNVFPRIDIGKKIQKRKSRSGKRRTEGLLILESSEDLGDVANESNTNSDTQRIKAFNIGNQTKPVTSNFEADDNGQGIVRNCDLLVETDIGPSNANKVCPGALMIDDMTQTGKDNQAMLNMRDAGDGLIEPTLGNKKLIVESSKNIPDDFLSNTLNLKATEVLKTPKKRGRPPKNKKFPTKANTSVNELDINFAEQTQIQLQIPDELVKNILPFAEPVAEIKKPNKRSRSLKKKSVNSDTEEPISVSSGNSFSSHDDGIESTIKDIGTNFIEGTHMHTQPIENLTKNIFDLSEPVKEMEKLGKGLKSSKTENLNSKTEETSIMTSLLTENLGIEITDKEEKSNLIEQTDASEQFADDFNSAESIAETKKPVKRKSRSEKKSLDNNSDETILESSGTSFLSEDIGIGSSNEEVENYLTEPQPEFAEPEVKTLKVRKRSKSIKRKNSSVESPIDSLLSDSSFNSSVSEDFGETSISEVIVKKLPRRISRSQKSQSPLEEQKLSNILTDMPQFDACASVLNEKIVSPDNTDKEIKVLSQNMKKGSKLVKNKVSAEIDESLNLASTDTSLNEVSDIFGDPNKNLVNIIHETVHVNAEVPKNNRIPKISKVGKFETPTNLTDFLERNCNLPDKVGETNHENVAEFNEPVVLSKRRSRLVRKKPIIDCTDSEEETNDNFINDTQPIDDKELDRNIEKAEAVLCIDTASDCIETRKKDKRSKSLKSMSLLSKTDHLTTATNINTLSTKIDNLIEDVVEPEVKDKKRAKGRSKLSKNTLKSGDIFIDTQCLPVSISNLNDTILDKIDIDNTPTLSFDEEVNNIKLKSKDKRGSLKNIHKKKNKASKIILPQLKNDKLSDTVEGLDLPQNNVLNGGKNLKEVSADALELEKSKENIFSVDGILKENFDTPIEPETGKTIGTYPDHKTDDCVDSPNINCQEPPIKIIINKQKTRRKSKSFKKVDLKGQNDLFEDFALVIKKPKRIVPIVAYIPVETFPKDMYQNYIKKPVEQPPPVPKSAPEETMEELTADLDASVEEMDMELDEIPITSNIIENLSFTATPSVTGLFGKADIGLLAETLITPIEENSVISPEIGYTLISPEKGNPLILPEEGNALLSPENVNTLILPEKGNCLIVPEKTNELQVTKKRGRPAKNKVLKDIQIEELFQTPEKELPLSIEVEEEFLYETNKRSNRKKSAGDTGAFVQEADTLDKIPKAKNKISLDTSLELAQDINNVEISSSVPPIGKFVDKTIESVANIFDFISGISNNDEEGANILEESPISNNKPKKLKYNNEMEVQADLEGDSMEFIELNNFLSKETETIGSFSNEIKPKRNKRKKSKSSNLLEIEPIEEPVNINCTLNLDPSINIEKDIDSIYAFTELDDLEIALPIEKPKRIPKKQTKLFSESVEHRNDSLEDPLIDSAYKTDIILVAEDIQKDFKPDTEDNIGEVVPKPIIKRRSGRDIFNTILESKEEIVNTGEIKENNINIDIPENGRRRSIRSAKVKALEHIHDDALAELTESERNRDLDRDKIVPTEENLMIPDELSKKKCNRRQSRAQSAPNLTEDPEMPVAESTENSILLADLTETVAEYVEPELNNLEITSTSDESTKKKSTKKPSKAQKAHLPVGIEKLPETEESSQLLANLPEDIIGLEKLENGIERELNSPQIEVAKKRTKPVKNKIPKDTKDFALVLNEPTNETTVRNDLLVEENNQELRRSRRGSRKIASYNENDLIDPLLDEIDGKRKNRKKEKTEEDHETVPAIDNKVVKKVKLSGKKLNSDELFDLLKASSKENVNIPKAPNSILSNLGESSRDFNDENFENVFENILEKSAFLIQNTIIDRSKEEKDIDKIYEFAESPESNNQTKDDCLLSESKKKIHKKLPKRNMTPTKLLTDDNSDSVLNGAAAAAAAAASDSFSIPTTPDFHESSADSKAKPTRIDQVDASDKTNYCEICNKSFIRIENLIKHKRTLTHIQKLSEIEAKEAAKKSKVEDTQNECSKTSNSIIEVTSDSSKVTLDSSKTDINISDILHESNKPSDAHSPIVHSSFPNNHSLKLADIINDVLNKPVLEGDNEKHNSFSDIIMQNNTDLQPEYRRYKSLGERKSFDSEPTEPQPLAMTEPYISKTTILEKQISLLENIIENQTGVNYIDDISMSSNNSLENNVLENNSARESPSVISLKQDDSSNVTYTRNNPLKPSAEDSFLKPSQYEEISEDSINQRNYEDQKLRKTLNRDEELFLECCSLLKSGSEVSNYSNKKSQNKVLSTMGLKQCDEPEWLERKSLVQKPLYEVVHGYSDDNSRIPTPLGDSYDDDASNSNTISSNWNMNKKVPIFEDISQEKQESANQSFTFEEVLNEYEEHGSKNKNAISKFGVILSKTINNQINAVQKMIRTPRVTENYEGVGFKKKQEEYSDCSTVDNKKVITKGARKVFEGLKVSIPTEELNLEEVLNCSPKSKKFEIASIQSLVESAKLTEEAPSSQNKPLRTARKSKPVKNKSQFGSNLLFKMNKKKVLSPTSGAKKKDGDIKTHDIYDFEETQDNTDVFTKPDFRTFRSMKSNEMVPEPESDTESRDYLDSFSVGAQSVTSSLSSSSSKKAKTQENITKKKCMIMGRIFKNAAKSKMEDIDEEMRDIPVIDNSELIESYVANCKNVIKNEEVAKPKLSENEINELFDQLLENKLNNLDTVHSESRTTVKSKSDIKKIDNKKKLKAKNKKRPRTTSESTDDEFSLSKTTKKRAYRKNAKAEDNCINLEQELKECIGVASRKSQRKCTSGKQNVLVEYWSSDDSQFEALLESQRVEARQSTQVVEQDNSPLENDLVPQPQEYPPAEDNLIELPKPAVPEILEKPHKPKNVDKKPQLKRKLSSERKPKSSGTGSGKNIDTITSNRRKRAAANPLYHWSSSSEDESQDLIEVKPIRDELEDDEDRPVQHGWIVGDSPKKLVTMLAQAKGKKTDIDCVKEQGKKRTNAVS